MLINKFQVPGYHFEYGVKDPHTKDHKTQDEHREHDDVKGSYTLKEADGTKRIVEYTSGKKDGFQAVVKRVGHAQHPGHHGHDDGGTSYVGVTHWGHGSGRQEYQEEIPKSLIFFVFVDFCMRFYNKYSEIYKYTRFFSKSTIVSNYNIS